MPRPLRSRVPGVAILTVIGGYLFGWLHGTALVLIAATVGASAVFLLTRSAFGDRLRARAGPAVQRFAEGFRRNALSYGFVLNVVPIFPYALIILVPAACGVPLLTFLAGMFLGLVPGTFLFAGLGDGLDAGAGERRAAASDQLSHAGDRAVAERSRGARAGAGGLSSLAAPRTSVIRCNRRGRLPATHRATQY